MTDESEHGPLLTDRQRRHLRGETDIEDGSAADRSERSRIRKRVGETIMDFQFLFHHLTPADRDMIVEREGVIDGIVAAIGLFYEMHEMNHEDFGETLERAIAEAYLYGVRQRDMPNKEVRGLKFEPDIHDVVKPAEVLDRLKQKLERGEEVTDYEFRIGITFGGVELQDALLKHDRERHYDDRREDTKEEIRFRAGSFRDENIDARTLSETRDESDIDDE